MQTAVPVGVGGMAAILGLDDDTVRAVCAEASATGVVEAVNFNAPAQVVIAGTKAGIEKACEIAKEKGAKRALPLPVSAPFHSSLLKPASDKLREYLAGVDVKAPKISVVNNIDVAVVSDPAAIKDALVRQAAGPVRWVECVQHIAREGVTHVIECGPGKVLASLTKRIDGNLVGASVFDPASIDEALKLAAAGSRQRASLPIQQKHVITALTRLSTNKSRSSPARRAGSAARSRSNSRAAAQW